MSFCSFVGSAFYKKSTAYVEYRFHRLYFDGGRGDWWLARMDYILGLHQDGAARGGVLPPPVPLLSFPLPPLPQGAAVCDELIGGALLRVRLAHVLTLRRGDPPLRRVARPVDKNDIIAATRLWFSRF